MERKEPALISLLARLFIKPDPAREEPETRRAYGVLCGIVGICLNVLLFAGKFLAGTLSGSIAITADAFNNLSDIGSNAVTLLGFKLANQPPDPEHPFGHGRMEYMSAALVSILIVLVGVELLKESVDKILHPQPLKFSYYIIAVLAASILIKLWMGLFNRKLGRTAGHRNRFHQRLCGNLGRSGLCAGVPLHGAAYRCLRRPYRFGADHFQRRQIHQGNARPAARHAARPANGNRTGSTGAGV